MVTKLIILLFGKLTPKQQEWLLGVLERIVKAGAEGAVRGIKKQVYNWDDTRSSKLL